MTTKKQVCTQNLRDVLKTIMEIEIARLPEYLEQLETKDKLNYLCRLMPFVFPKVDPVHQLDGEY